MRFKIFHTEKPRRFSFHTRYYDENKLATEGEASIEKGSFSKFKSKYRTNMFEKQHAEEDSKRRFLLLSIFFGLFTVALIAMGYYMYGAIPGVLFLVAVLFLLKKASNK